MQVKIVITTIAFMLTMIIFGYASIREPARMETFTNAYEGRRIEWGGDIFHGNCATCHGEHGKAELCYDAEGEQIGCAGLALNNRELLCGERTPRMEAMGWLGTKEAFIGGTITAGRPWANMPTWGSDFGGSLQPYEVGYVTAYVLNWEDEELCAGPPPEPVIWPSTVPDLIAETAAGDAVNGEQLYNVAYGCAACHGDPVVDGSNAVGPWAGNFQNLDEVRVAGYTAADYMYESILEPSDYISPDCPAGPCAGPPSSMPANFGLRMSFQDMVDIMAFLNVDVSSSSGAEIVPPPAE